MSFANRLKNCCGRVKSDANHVDDKEAGAQNPAATESNGQNSAGRKDKKRRLCGSGGDSPGVRMALNCGTVFAKYLLCFFNFIFFAAGGTVLALSIWLAVDNTSFLILTRVSENDSLQEFNQPSVMEHGAYILIVAGGLVFCIGFLGCCGAVLESRVLLTIYGLTVIVIFLLEVTGGALAAVYKAETEEELQNFLKLTLKKYYSTQATANSMTVSWNALMAELKCCGVNNYTDFELATMWQTNKTDGMVMPVACCILEGDPKKFKPLDPSCVSDPSPENSYYLTGCLGRLQENTFYYLPTMLSVAIGLGTLQLILITLSFYMCRAIGKALKVATVD
ncbi:tetraspanin-1 isoform X2 [Macrobrachium rosenbergii]|uniref:tetraspanin-1 isoform X2 n=1 Tax=Macrobrachium rosenbergii TaxID=79674 RepID=UPI0034D62896